MSEMISTMKRRKKYGFLTDVAKNPFSYLLALPAVVYTFIFGYMTLPFLIMAFQQFSYERGLLQNQWIGFKNFEFFFRATDAFVVTRNTLVLNFLFIAAATLAGMFFSIAMSEVKNKAFLKITQSTFLFPHFVSWIVVSYVVYAFLSSDYGVINKLLKFAGLEPVNWYYSPEKWPAILVLMRVWKDTGIKTVIFLATISGINHELYEAAVIDGANSLQRIKAITIPLLMPTVIILTLLAIGKIFYGDFAMIYSIIHDNGILYPTADVIDTYVYRLLRLTGNPAQAMAVGLYQAVMGFILVYGSNRIARRYSSDSALF